MLLMGMLIGALIRSYIPSALWEIEPFLKSLALIIILLRAGLGINRRLLRRIGKTAILMSFIPCLFEGVALILILHYFFDFSFLVAGMAAFILAAVSPAVIVPAMLNFRELGLGSRKEIPTLILAGASVDDVFAITVYALFLRQFKSVKPFAYQDLLYIPWSAGTGIILGLLFGFALVWFFRRHYKNIRATEKVIVLLGFCLALVEIGNLIGIASLLGAMTIGYVLFEKENKIAHEISQKLSKIWVLAEIILFVLIGISVDLNALWSAGWKGIVVIVLGLVFRSLGVIAATAFSNLNRQEKLFCIITYLPKATVQAALGSIPLALGIPGGGIILALAVMSIILTAPVSLLLNSKFSTKLLTRKAE